MINICDSNKTLSMLVTEHKIGETLRADIMNADIVIVPTGFRDAPMAFVAGTSDIFAQLQSKAVCKIEICCEDIDYEEIELNSSVLRLGDFFCKRNVESFLIGVLASISANQCSSEKEPTVTNNIQQTEVILGMPSYTEPTTVKFTITSFDEQNGKQKTFQYEGTPNDVTTVKDAIKDFWIDYDNGKDIKKNN